jgi:hypothetical protein
VPFVFVTGYAGESLPRDYAERPRIGKPFKSEHLIRTLLHLIEVPIIER